MKKGFSLIELLVVIAIIASLLAILYPSLARARMQAKVLTVNYELGQIGLALNAYEITNKDWPPTRYDCSEQEHMYSLPSELVNGGYIAKGGKKGKVVFSSIEDKFYPGHTYRYIAPGALKDYSNSPFLNMTVYVSASYPADMEQSGVELLPSSLRKDSPVKWALLSLGPNYDIAKMEQQIKSGKWRGFELKEGFPFTKAQWYSPQTRAGLLTRIKTSKDQFVGSFQNR